MVFFILAVFFIGGGWLLGKIVGNLLFPKEEDSYFPIKKPSKTIIHNHNPHKNKVRHFPFHGPQRIVCRILTL